MVIARLLGGLGNQMFQFAAASVVARRLGMELQLDTAFLTSRNSHNGYELEHTFGISTAVAAPKELRRVLGITYPLRWYAAHLPFAKGARSGLVAEPSYTYWPGIESVRAPVYLAGYWQSELYFALDAAAIREAFKFHRTPPAEGLADVEQLISGSSAVSVHIRRGDYVSNPKMTATHGLLPLSYFHEACRLIAREVANPMYFVFSDDLAWARQYLELPYPMHFVHGSKGRDSFNDMRLMSLCRHHVIANSTFSWWAAWLNPSAHKIVVAPRKWFAYNQQETSTLLPSSWISV